jgi:plastocyanin
MWHRKLGVGLALLAVLALALPVPAQAQGMGWPGGGMMGPSMGSTTASGALTGCGRGPQRVGAAAISELPRVTISVEDGVFNPSDVTVPRGTVVVWTNRGSRPHSTTSWDRWNDILNPGESCAVWFVTPGTYQYLSIVAADGGTMTGSITVSSDPIGGGMSGGMMGPGTGTGSGSGGGY